MHFVAIFRLFGVHIFLRASLPMRRAKNVCFYLLFTAHLLSASTMYEYCEMFITILFPLRLAFMRFWMNGEYYCGNAAHQRTRQTVHVNLAESSENPAPAPHAVILASKIWNRIFRRDSRNAKFFVEIAILHHFFHNRKYRIKCDTWDVKVEGTSEVELWLYFYS